MRGSTSRPEIAPKAQGLDSILKSNTLAVVVDGREQRKTVEHCLLLCSRAAAAQLDRVFRPRDFPARSCRNYSRRYSMCTLNAQVNVTCGRRFSDGSVVDCGFTHAIAQMSLLLTYSRWLARPAAIALQVKSIQEQQLPVTLQGLTLARAERVIPVANVGNTNHTWHLWLR